MNHSPFGHICDEKFTPGLLMLDLGSTLGDLEAGCFTEFPADELTIGRSILCTVRLLGARIGYIHARLVRYHDAFFLVPTGTGAYIAIEDTWLNPADMTPVMLEDNQMLHIGRTRFLFVRRYPVCWIR